MIGQVRYKIKVVLVAIDHMWYKSRVGDTFIASMYINPITKRPYFYDIEGCSGCGIAFGDVIIIDELYVV